MLRGGVTGVLGDESRKALQFILISLWHDFIMILFLMLWRALILPMETVVR